MHTNILIRIALYKTNKMYVIPMTNVQYDQVHTYVFLIGRYVGAYICYCFGLKEVPALREIQSPSTPYTYVQVVKCIMLWNGLLSLLYYELFQLEFLNSKLPFEVFTLCAQQRLIHSNTTVSTPHPKQASSSSHWNENQHRK